MLWTGGGSSDAVLNVVEPWDAVFAFLETLPETKDTLPELQEHLGRSRLCMFLAFSMNKRSGRPVVKTYHAYDRTDRGVRMPLLASYRLEGGTVRAQPKFYNLLQGQDIENVDTRLAPVAARVVQGTGPSLSGSAWLPTDQRRS